MAGSLTETLGYDAIGRLTSHAGALGSFTLAWLGQTDQIASRQLASSSLATSWTYLPNSGDRRLASIGTVGIKATQNSTFAYTTNAMDETTGVTQTSDAAIASPALSTQSASYNNLNQLTNLTGQAFTFDADGNLTSDGQRTYSWDAENRLIAIAYPGQSGKATTFAYDGLGRRVQIASTPKGGHGAVTTGYLWCGQVLCQARNASNQVSRGYYAEGEIAPSFPANSYYYAPDRLGSVRRAFASGASPTYDFDAYGAALQAAAPVTDFGYAGMVTNTDSGLYLTTHRPYDPVTGRFLTRDPIGEAGDPLGNLYAYVGGDPVDESDPMGLFLLPWESPVTVSGGTTAQRSTVTADVQNIFNTSRGNQLLNEIIGPWWWHGSPKTINLNCNNRNDAETPGQNINIDPVSARNTYIMTNQGLKPLDLTRIVAHELGHATTGTGDPQNIYQNENPIMNQLGQSYSRTDYHVYIP